MDIVLSETGGGLETIPRGPSIPLGPWDPELSVRVGEGKDPAPRTDRPRGWLHAPGHVLCLRSACQSRPFELFIQKDVPRPRAPSHLHSHPRPPILKEGCCPCAPLRFNPTCDAPLPVFDGVARRSPELASACSGPGWAGLGW